MLVGLHDTCSTDEVKQEICNLLSCQYDVGNLTRSSVGNCSPILTHRLKSNFHRGSSLSSGLSQIVSQYAAIQVAHILGPEEIRRKANSPEVRDNPTLRGWFFEAYFFCSVWSEKELVLRTTDGDTFIFTSSIGWRQIKLSDPQADDCLIGELLQCTPFNTPSIDGLLLRPTGGGSNEVVAQFVQVTLSDKHKIDLRYFKDFLDKAIARGLISVSEVEICFVVPTAILEDFEVQPIDNCDALATYGWPSDIEGVRSKLKIVGLDGGN